MVGHIIRLCGYTNTIGAPWLLQDLIALLLELLASGYIGRGLFGAYSNAIRANPALKTFLSPLNGILMRFLFDPREGSSRPEALSLREMEPG